MRNMLVSVVVATAALPLASTAAAHVGVSPAFLAADDTAVLTFDAPNEREAEPMTALVVQLPEGLQADSTGQLETEGWTLTVTGNEAVWTGGAVVAGESQTFQLEASASGEPGAVTIQAEQRYESGATVEWSPSFTILPPAGDSPNQQLGWALIAAIVGLVVIGASLVLARRLRRRTLQEE